MKELVKLYYRIGEVSQIVGVQPHVLRYWESEFRTIRPQKSSKGQRVYSRKDVEKLLRVKDLLRNQGFTIAGARRRLAQGGAGPAGPSPAGPLAGRSALEPPASTERLQQGRASSILAPRPEARDGMGVARPSNGRMDAGAQGQGMTGGSVVGEEPLAARKHDGPPNMGSSAPGTHRPITSAPVTGAPVVEQPVVVGTGQCCAPLPEEPAPRMLGESRRADRHARSMRRALLSVRVELTALLSQLSEPVS